MNDGGIYSTQTLQTPKGSVNSQVRNTVLLGINMFHSYLILQVKLNISWKKYECLRFVVLAVVRSIKNYLQDHYHQNPGDYDEQK